VTRNAYDWKMHALLVALLVLVGLVIACNTGPGSTSPSSTAPSCMHDEDCQVGACGPCEANARITPEALTQECAVNPCPGMRAYCTAAGTCAVR
jgi:hypothetical protein